MLDSNNYTLDHYSINRSAGAKLNDRYLPPKKLGKIMENLPIDLRDKIDALYISAYKALEVKNVDTAKKKQKKHGGYYLSLNLIGMSLSVLLLQFAKCIES